jgi:hypothetical protein
MGPLINTVSTCAPTRPVNLVAETLQADSIVASVTIATYVAARRSPDLQWPADAPLLHGSSW